MIRLLAASYGWWDADSWLTLPGGGNLNEMFYILETNGWIFRAVLGHCIQGKAERKGRRGDAKDAMEHCSLCGGALSAFLDDGVWLLGVLGPGAVVEAYVFCAGDFEA